MRCRGDWWREHWPLLAIVIVFIAFEIFFLSHDPLLLWDEPVYLANARGHLEETFFEEDFRFPLLEFLIAGVWLLTGISVVSAQLLIVFFSAAAIVLFYFIAAEVSRRRWIAAGAAAVLAFGGLLAYWGFRVYTDVPALAFLLAAVLLFLRFEDHGDRRLVFFSGFFISLAFLVRFPTAAMVMAFLPFLVSRRRWKHLVVFVAGGLLASLPWMMYNIVRYGSPFWDLFAQAQVIGMYTSWQPVSLFLGHLWSSTGLLLVLLLLFIWSAIRRPDRKTFFIGSLAFIAFIGGLATPFKLERYALLVVPFLLLACTAGAALLFERLRLLAWRRVLVIFIVLLAALQVSLGMDATIDQLSWQRRCYASGATAQAIAFAEEHVPEGSLVISNAWTWYGFFGNHEARSVWSSDIAEVLHDDDEGWLFVHSHFGRDGSRLVFNGSRVVSFVGDCDGTVDVYKVQK